MIHFGTGGWRAVIGDDFTKANIRILAAAMAAKMHVEGVAEKGVVIGYDRRFLSKETVYWSCEVLAAAGIPCAFVNHSVPTPLIMYYTMVHEFPYGMMVTASHNPSLYNGIKVFTYGGRDADEAQTADIERYAGEVVPEEIPSIPYEEAVEKGIVREIYPMNEYLDYLTAKVDLKAIREAHLRIAVDPMYGVSETALSTMLISARCELYVIHQEHDPLFGGRMPAPNKEVLGLLQNYVAEKHCSLGLALDGDGDRLGVIDDRGRYLDANDILVLLYYCLIRYKGWHGPVVRNLATTHRLDVIAAQYGETCYEVPVGFKYISAKMAEVGAILGGESSGGLTVAGHINGKDAVYAACLLTEMLAVSGKKLSELMAVIDGLCGTWYTEERAHRFSEEKRALLSRVLLEDRALPDLSPHEVDHVSCADGCKVYLSGGGWVLVRFSGTEPLLRLCSEMPSQREAEEVCSRFEDFLGLGR